MSVNALSSMKFSALILALVHLCAPTTSFANIKTAPANLDVGQVPKEIKGAEVTEHLGDTVSINDITLRDETGKPVKLAEFFHKGRPVLLNLGYYGCPMLCSMVLNGMTDSMKGVTEWTPGREYEILSVSIDPTEGPELAAKKKQAYLESFGRPEAASGWHFLTGTRQTEDQIRKLAGQVGFGYKYDAEQKQYAHGAVLVVLTPEGRVSRYLYGMKFFAKDLKLALLEASNGKIGNVIERILLFCYRYDPQSRKYSVYLNRVMQAGSAGTIVLFGGYLAVFWRGQRKRKNKEGSLT